MAIDPLWDPALHDPNYQDINNPKPSSNPAYGPFRSGSAKELLGNLQSNLGESYKVTSHGDVTGAASEGGERSFTRISISHRGGAEMVIDLRTIELESKEKLVGAIKGSPLIAIRQQGQVGEAAERTFSGKTYRDELTKGSTYRVYDAVQEVADVIRGGHKYYEEEPSARGMGKSPTEAFTAVLGSAETGRGGDLMKRIREEFHIASSSGIAWGQQRRGFYEELASKISVYWGPEAAYKEQTILRRSLANMRNFAKAPLFYDPSHGIVSTWDQARRTSKYGYEEEEVELAREGAEGLKTFKQLPSLRQSREEVHPLISSFNEETGKVMRTRLSAPTPDEILGTGGDPNRDMVYGERLGRRGGIWMNIRGEVVLAGSTIVTQTPSGAGAAYVSKTAIPQFDSAGNRISFGFKGSQQVPLPWETPEDFTRVARLTSKEGVGPLDLNATVGKSSGANARTGVKVGTVSIIDENGQLKQKPIFSESKSYEAQIDAVTLVVPKFFNTRTNQFSAIIPSGLSEEDRAGWQESSAMDADLRRLAGKQKLNIEYTGTNKMYLSLATTGIVDPGFKLKGVKESETQTWLEGWQVDVPGVGKANASSITQEVKSGGDLWIGAWEAQPFENKMRMLGMVDTRLEKKVRHEVELGKISSNDLDPQYIANKYAELDDPHITGKRLEYNSPREIFGKAVAKILDEQDPLARGANYRRYGIYKVTNDNERMATELIDEEAKNQFIEDYRKGNHVDPSTDGIDFIKEGNMFRVVSKIPIGSYVLPKVIGLAAEWPMGGGKIPTQAVAKFNQAFPDTAEGPGISTVLGLQASSGVLGAGKAPSNVRAWVDLVKSDKLRNDSLKGISYKTRNTLMIDQKIASNILSEIGITANDLSGKPVTQDQIKKLKAALSKNGMGNEPDMLFFKGTQSYMPATNVPYFLDEFNKATGASQTGMSNRYFSAVLDLLDAEQKGRAQPGSASRRWNTFTGGMIDRSDKANKVLSSIRTPTAMSRNYNIMDQLGPNEGAISDAQIEAIARQQPGVYTDADVKKFVDHVNQQGYLPAFFHRIPSVGGVYAIKLLTAKTLAKRDPRIDINADITSNQSTIWINRWMHESGIGDRDIDKALIWTGLMTKKENGTLTIKDLVTSTSQWKAAMRRTGDDYIREFKAQFGDDATAEALVRKYSHIGQYYADYHDAVKSGYDRNKTADYGWVRAGYLNDVSKMWGDIRTRRGTSYNAIRIMEESLAVLGVTAGILNKALGSYGIQTVQSSVEATPEARMGDPLEKFFPSIKYDQEGGLRFSVGLPDEKSNLKWTRITGGDTQTPREQLLRSFLTAYTSGPYISDEMIAIQFGDVNDPTLSRDILKTIAGAKGHDRFDLLMDHPSIVKRIMSATSLISIPIQIGLENALNRNKDIPFDLKEQLFKDMAIPELNKGGLINKVMSAIKILKAVRTGKDVRSFSIEQLMEAASDPNITPGPEADRLMGVSKDFGVDDLDKIPLIQEWGGLGKGMLTARFKQGMRSMRASDFGHIAAGIEAGRMGNLRGNKLLYQKVLSATSEWIGQMYQLGDTSRTTDIFDQGEDAINLEAGTTYESLVLKKLKEKVGIHVGAGRAITADMGGTEIRFIPDFLKLEKGRLRVTEVKTGGGSNAAAGVWQAAVNKYGILAAYEQNESRLRSILSDYKKNYDESLGTPEGEGLPTLKDTWVEEVMEAVKEGKVDAQVISMGKNVDEMRAWNVNLGKNAVETMIGKVVKSLQTHATESAKALERLGEGETLRTTDKHTLKTVPGFKLPMGITESFTRLVSYAKFRNPGKVGKWITNLMEFGSNPIIEPDKDVIRNKFGIIHDVISRAEESGSGFATPNRDPEKLIPPDEELALPKPIIDVTQKAIPGIQSSNIESMVNQPQKSVGQINRTPEEYQRLADMQFAKIPPDHRLVGTKKYDTEYSKWEYLTNKVDAATAQPSLNPKPAMTPTPFKLTPEERAKDFNLEPEKAVGSTPFKDAKSANAYYVQQVKFGVNPADVQANIEKGGYTLEQIGITPAIAVARQDAWQIRKDNPALEGATEAKLPIEKKGIEEIRSAADAMKEDALLKAGEIKGVTAADVAAELAKKGIGGAGTPKGPTGGSSGNEYSDRNLPPLSAAQVARKAATWGQAQKGFGDLYPDIEKSSKALLERPDLGWTDPERERIFQAAKASSFTQAATALIATGTETGKRVKELVQSDPEQMARLQAAKSVREGEAFTREGGGEGGESIIERTMGQYEATPEMVGGRDIFNKLKNARSEAGQGSQELGLAEAVGAKKGGAGGTGGGKDIMPMTEDQIANLNTTAGKLGETFKGVGERMADTNKIAMRSTEVWKSVGLAAESSRTLGETIKKVEDSLAGLGETLPSGYNTKELAEAALVKGQEMYNAPGATPEQQAVGRELVTGAQTIADQGTRAEKATETYMKSEQADFGHVARRALGGFGVMYLRSMFGLATGGFAPGMQESQSLRAQFTEGAAQASGIGQRYMTPQQQAQVSAGLFGTPSSPLDIYAKATSKGIGREISGAAQMGIGTFAATQWFGDMAGKESDWNKRLTGNLGMGLTIGAVALGAAADVYSQSTDPKSLAFKMAQQTAGRGLSLTAPVSELIAQQTQPTYEKELRIARAAAGASGLSPKRTFTPTWTDMGGVVSDMSLANPQQDVLTGMQRAAGTTNVASAISKSLPAWVSAQVALHPETQAVAPEVVSFMAQNRIKNSQYERLATQWGYGLSNTQTLQGMGQVFGQNLSYLNQGGQMGSAMMQLANMEMPSQQRDIVLQGMQFGQGLGHYGSSMGLTSPDQWVNQSKQWAGIAGTPYGDVYSRQAQLSEATAGTRAQAPAAYIPSGITTDNPRYAEWQEEKPTGPATPFRWLPSAFGGKSTYEPTKAAQAAYRAELTSYFGGSTGAAQKGERDTSGVPSETYVRPLTTAESAPYARAIDINTILANTYQTQMNLGLRANVPLYLGEGQTATEQQVANAQAQQDSLLRGEGKVADQMKTILSQRGISGTEQLRLIGQLQGDRPGSRGTGPDRRQRPNMLVGGEGQRTLAYGGAYNEIQANVASYGGTMPNLPQILGNGGIAQQFVGQTEAAAQGLKAQQPWIQMGIGTQASAQKWAETMGGATNPALSQFMQGMAQQQPLYMTALAGSGYQGAAAMRDVFNGATQAGGFQGLSGNNVPAWQVAMGMSTGTNFVGPTGIGPVNGLPYGQVSWATSLQGGAAAAQNIFGGSFAKDMASGGWKSPGGTASTGGVGANVAAVNASVYGFTLPGTNAQGEPNVVGGMMAMQLQGAQNSYNYAMASAGNQMANLNLNYAFTTGVGIDKYANTINPVTGGNFGFPTGRISGNVAGVGSYRSEGGGFWGIQEAQQQLGWMQQQNQFSAQRQQMGIQSSQFYTNMAMNQQQMGMQRGWTQQDWGYNAQTRNLQWGWKQQDFQENVRFMTGRDRRLAERQMGRETTMHDLEGDQIEKQKERQKELWDLEDQRFEIQKTQFEENQNFQQEQLDIAIAFFEERKDLEKQSMAMQRAYWVNQMDLQKQAIGISAGAARSAYELSIAMAQAQLKLEQASGAAGTLATQSFALLTTMINDYAAPAILDLTGKIAELYRAAQGQIDVPGGEDEIDYVCSVCGAVYHNPIDLRNHRKDAHDINYEAAGTSEWAFSPMKFVAGEGALPEKVTVEPLGSGSYKSRWTNEVISTNRGIPTSEPQMIHLTVNIGDEPIIDRIVDAITQNIKD